MAVKVLAGMAVADILVAVHTVAAVGSVLPDAVAVAVIVRWQLVVLIVVVTRAIRLVVVRSVGVVVVVGRHMRLLDLVEPIRRRELRGHGTGRRQVLGCAVARVGWRHRTVVRRSPSAGCAVSRSPSLLLLLVAAVALQAALGRLSTRRQAVVLGNLLLAPCSVGRGVASLTGVVGR